MKNLYSKVMVLLVALLSMGQGAMAQDLASPLPKDPKVTIGKFANGLTYYIRTNKKPENKVELRLVVNAGSILEDNDQQGLAHFMEHMNFNGTKNFQKNDLVGYLQSIGVEFGADLNAYTSFDETVYILPIPTDKPGNLEKGFQIIEDWAHNALLTDKDIDEERAVVLEESRLGKGADMRMLQKYLPEMMAGSRYAERLPIGKDDILKNFKYDVIRRYYKDWYRPDLMAVVVVGDISTEEAMKYLKKHFEPMTNPKNAKKRFDNPVPARTTPKAMVLTDKEATGSQLQIIFPAIKKEKETDVKDYRESIVEGLMQQVINRRLSELTNSENPPFPYAGVAVSGWARGYEGLLAYTGFGEEGPEKAMMALTAEMKRANEFGFNESEVELAKKGMMSFIEKAYNERNTTESGRLVGEYIRNFLDGEPIPGIEKEYEYYNQMMPGIKAEELTALFNKYMSNMNTFTLITAPEESKGKLPTDATLLQMTQKGFAQKVTAKEETKVASSLIDKEPAGGKVVSKESQESFKATTYTLSNGVMVTVKPTTYKTDEIIFRGVKKGGSNNYGVKDVNNVKYAVDVTDAMGSGQFTPTDLEKVLAGKNISLSASIGEVSNTISGSSSVKDFETLMQLMYLSVTQPRTDKALFEAYKQKQKMQLQFLSANPQVSFIDTMYNTLYAGNPLAPSPIPKVSHFDDINAERIVEIFKNEFMYADGYHFYLVGNVDEKTALPLIEKYLGSLPKAGKEPSFKDNGVRPVSGTKVMKFYKGSEPKSLILSVNHGEAKYSEDFELKVQALAEILNIRVIEELREKLGGIYGGGYRASLERYPYENYSLMLQLPCGPENVDKLLAGAKTVVDEIIEKGPKEEDLKKVKSTWHEQHRESVEKNGYWAAQMQGVLFWGKSQDHIFNYDQWIDKLTVKDMQETAKQLFQKGNSFTAILYPEEKK